MTWLVRGRLAKDARDMRLPGVRALDDWEILHRDQEQEPCTCFDPRVFGHRTDCKACGELDMRREAC